MSEKPPAYAPGYPPQPEYSANQPGYPPQQPGYPSQQPVYHNQPPGYPPPQGHQGQQASTVVVGVPSVTVVGGLHEGPMNVTCPNCHQSITTRISYEAGCLAWVICAVLIVLGCWLGCCLIPFCVNGCKDVRHTCPNCNTTVGVYRRM